MARKSLTAVPIPTFLGKQRSRMEQAHAAEYRRQPLMALAQVLNRNFELPPMSTLGPEWERVAEWSWWRTNTVGHYAAYLRATKRDDRPYLILAESLKQKPPAPQRQARRAQHNHPRATRSRQRGR